ncbi:uncharacterized protein K02A2.6-like [Plodia interpunctella]|uniref:uncharacterized protein K02A2.6-like n=1 Tax=Plodia interpunctella TaxID=58824 RepID=UPI0023686D18|nr:uncharacterized protein K02A2.6-like [Plodia interpunctella]
MLRDGVIEPVDCSEWASPLVPVSKADGSLRICADYKATVNPALVVDRYPLPKVDDLLQCEQAFTEVKRLLVSAEVLMHYDPSLPLTVTCDASARGVGGVLSQPIRATYDENGADGLSRLPVAAGGKQMSHASSNAPAPEQTYLHFIQQELLLDYNVIKSKTSRNPLLAKVLSYLRDGWPSDCEIMSMKPYFNRKDGLYEELGCVMWGHRLVVPDECRERVLRMIHEPHMGIVKSKALARSYVWWPGVNEDVERLCRECAVCASQADAPPRQTPRMWPWPNRPWSRVHLDFLGPIFGKTYLVLVDAMSKWIEVCQVSSTAATGTIGKISELFSRWGLPKQIVTDNGPPFFSAEFANFVSSQGIEHIFSPPYHPASNGLAENAVKSLKRVIKKASAEKQDIDKALCTFLLHYRNTEHSTTGESPAMLLLGRRLRTKLDALKPNREGKVREAQQRQKVAAKGSNRELRPNETVWYRQYLKSQKWASGQVAECVGPSNYKIRDKHGEVLHRHIDQLRRRTGGRSSLACPDTEFNTSQNESSTNSEPQIALPDAGDAAQSEEINDEAGKAETPLKGSVVSGLNRRDAPASPEFQDALPTVTTPPPSRPVLRTHLACSQQEISPEWASSCS